MIKDSKGFVFSAANFHVAESGRPPEICDDGSGLAYQGYFVNRYGEQWTITVDPVNKTGVLRGGDLGWEREIPIEDGQVDPDVILNAEEKLWVQACLLAAVGERSIG
jgi:hypothetical protein